MTIYNYVILKDRFSVTEISVDYVRELKLVGDDWTNTVLYNNGLICESMFWMNQLMEVSYGLRVSVLRVSVLRELSEREIKRLMDVCLGGKEGLSYDNLQI